jgi:hypothetical protein
MRVANPLALREQPLIVCAMTGGRTQRSARGLRAGTPAKATKTNLSSRKRSIRSKHLRMSKRLAPGPESLLECVRLRHVNDVLLAWRKVGVRTLRGPAQQPLILGVFLRALVDIAHGMDPTALMLALMPVGACVHIAAQHACTPWSDHLLHDGALTRVIVLVRAQGRGADAPERAMGLHCWTRSDQPFERGNRWFRRTPHAGKPFDDLVCADLASRGYVRRSGSAVRTSASRF